MICAPIEPDKKKLEDYYSCKYPFPVVTKLGEPSSRKDKDGDEEIEYQEPQHTMDMIFDGSSLYESRRHLKAVEREVNLVESPITGKPSRWLETVISFSKEDCPSLQLNLVKHLRPKMTPKPSDQTKEVPLDKGASPKSIKMSSGSGNANASTQKVLVGGRT